MMRMPFILFLFVRLAGYICRRVGNEVSGFSLGIPPGPVEALWDWVGLESCFVWGGSGYQLSWMGYENGAGMGGVIGLSEL